MTEPRAEGVERDLALLRTLAEQAIPGTPLDVRDCHGHWSPYFNFHGDPYVNDETPGWGSVATICTGPEDYGKSRAEFIAAADPATVTALVDVAFAAARILHPARGDAPWLHTAEFDDLRAALSRIEVSCEPNGPPDLPVGPNSIGSQ